SAFPAWCYGRRRRATTCTDGKRGAAADGFCVPAVRVSDGTAAGRVLQGGVRLAGVRVCAGPAIVCRGGANTRPERRRMSVPFEVAGKVRCRNQVWDVIQ